MFKKLYFMRCFGDAYNIVYSVVTLSIVNAYNVQLARQMISVSNLAKVITIGTIIASGIYNISSGKFYYN